jgi:hypothetical protein
MTSPDQNPHAFSCGCFSDGVRDKLRDLAGWQMRKIHRGAAALAASHDLERVSLSKVWGLFDV